MSFSVTRGEDNTETGRGKLRFHGKNATAETSRPVPRPKNGNFGGKSGAEPPRAEAKC
jgi:hypothetical protein